MPPTMKRRRSASPVSGGSNKKKNQTSNPSKKSPSNNNKQWKEWKKQRSHDYNTHQFLDASATVHAGLFGARRLPEIKSLWRQMVQGELSTAINDKQSTTVRRAGESGGGKISSRHLRRRTNSHKPKRYRRFPSDKKDDMSEKISSCDNQKQKQKKSPCRRARRKPALMKISHSQWWKDSQMNNIQMVQTHSPNWISTHMWHTKRFHMSQLFSWSVPLIHTNRGSRASLRLASSESFPKCTIQDATWEVNGCAIKLTYNDSSTSVQQQYQTLVSILQRLCGKEEPFLLNESMCTGQIRAGKCIIHEIDTCPLKPIGPASFIADCSEENASVSILIHPTIHQKISLLLNTIIVSYNDSNKGNRIIISTLPLALLRIRGRASTTTIRSILGDALSDEVIDNAEHGTVVNIESFSSSETRILLKCHQPNQNYKHLPHNLASSGYDIICHPSICSKIFQSFVTDGGACAIGLTEDVRAQLEAYPPLPILPRDYPDTEEGKAYWRGDTSEVINNEGDKRQANTSWLDWAVIRTCIEGSWGRINTPLKRTLRNRKQFNDQKSKQERGKKSSATTSDDQSNELQLINKHQVFGRETASIHWENLLSPNEESTIVVRGSFGIPFLQLLDGCGRLHAQSISEATEGKPKRRPRRKVKPPNSTIQASPLSKEEAEAHSNLCRQLRESLSLPAMLRCELLCDGKGSLSVGDLILPISLMSNDSVASISGEGSDCDDSEDGQSQSSSLGVVVTGGFSPSLGKCHGTGFVGAAKLIDALDGTMHGMGMTIPQSNGQRKMALKVKIIRNEASDGSSRFALLSILL